VNHHWVPTETLNEFLCYILTTNPDLTEVLYTSRCDLPPPFANSSVPTNISVLFHLQDEHTLTLQGPTSKIPYIYDSRTFYGVHIPYRAIHNNCIVIEYSQPNVEHVVRSGFHEKIAKKLVYVPPYFYSRLNKDNLNRSNILLTTFGDASAAGGRRINFLERMRAKGLQIENRNSLAYSQLMDVMDDTKILINMHQSHDRNTFEELRVLPAIMRKVVVISEISPLMEVIPYRDFVIWSTLDDMAQVINHTLVNYEQIYNRLHRNPSMFDKILEKMNQDTVKILTEKIRNVVTNKVK